MSSCSLTRRRFIESASLGLAGCVFTRPAFAAKSPAPAWTIGCLNRPWVKWSADEMLDGVRAAGYRTIGLQTTTAADKWVSNSSRDYLAALKEKIASRGLVAIQGRLTTKDTAPFDAATADIRQQVDNARFLGLKALINTGTAKPELYEAWYRAMHYAAGYAADAGIELVTKPHGGVVATAADLLRCVEKINHRNLGIWYDAGNVIHYTGLDPLQELEPILSHVTAFTAKDCAAKGGEVMIQFGQGKVDFPAIFRRLKKAGFKGPIMVESCAIGATAAETTANARQNREFLERTLASVAT
jgi:sugar phosphate isomerase/epimerase